ncbi:MAG: bifunctional [glutamate--ammonia ligase]-adenylyl-L-tyrosine phosphorylase/[glutamate--ammonia-ligase] adenylyltransferase [Pseudomonadota bacterium]
MADVGLGHDRSEMVLSQFSSAERETLVRDQPAREALSALALYSPALTQALSARVDLARWLFLENAFLRPANLESMPFELAAGLRNASGLEDLQAGLRRYKLKEFSRLAARDLTGRADLAEVVGVLSALADASLGLALETALRLTAERNGLTPQTLGFSPVVLGMGKLGARELNYSSDVDLIYLFKPRAQAGPAPAPGILADQVFSLVSRALSEVTEDGFVFRVDLNLRPGGKDGALAQSLETALKHYQLLGRPWERLALLKARPVAGDFEAGRWFLAELSPFIFRRHLDYNSLEELKDLKARFNREKAVKLSRLSGAGRSRPAVDIKLSPGGIREIEFFVQTLTLTFGGRLPHLRLSGTLETLAALAGEGVISDEDRNELSRSYIFLRTLEHRLQLRELTQTQTLPRDLESLDNLARSMGFDREPREAFDVELKARMSRVGARFDSLLVEPGKKTPLVESDREEWIQRLLDGLSDDEASRGILARVGFRRPDAALAALRAIQEQRFLPVPLVRRYGRHLERLLPSLVAGAASTPDPDRAILHLERFMAAIGPKAGFFILLEENPRLINLLSVLFGSSDYLSSVLINHPGILDSLIDRRSGRPVKDRKALAQDLGDMLGREDDPETALTIIRRFKNDETLRIGLYDLLDKIGYTQIRTQLTDLAELVMERTMELAAGLILPGWVPGAGFPLAVMGLGKLGGRELSYGSDLDLIFILDQDWNERVKGLETVVKLAQRFISYLSVHLEAGPGYEIDSRLRPSGGHGPLVTTLSSFAKYHETSQLWERQALLKLRRVVGSTSLGRRVKAAANQAIFHRPLPEDAAARIHNLRRRMGRERGRIKPGTINLKFSPGGLVDAEFLTQYRQMVLGGKAGGGPRSQTTRVALAALVKSGEDRDGLAEVIPAYDYLSRASSRLGLIYARSGDRAAYTREEIDAAHLPEAGTSGAARLMEAMAVIRTAYEKTFGGGIDDSGE